LLGYVRKEGIGLLAYSPLLTGAYTRQDRNFPEQYIGPDAEARLETLSTMAEEMEVTANQVVFAWLLQHDPPVIPLMAADSEEEMDENLGALEVHLSEAQISRLNGASG
jgi:aryl-alcohol dehydrogenase-like predicted oxidoreductase